MVSGAILGWKSDSNVEQRLAQQHEEEKLIEKQYIIKRRPENECMIEARKQIAAEVEQEYKIKAKRQREEEEKKNQV